MSVAPLLTKAIQIGVPLAAQLARSVGKEVRRGRQARRTPRRQPPRRPRQRNGSLRTVSAPAATSAYRRPKVATNQYIAVGQEILTSVYSSSTVNAYSGSSYSLNPIEPDVFCRLSAIASQYQKFALRSVSMAFTPTRGTTQTGRIAIAYAADPTTTIPTTWQDLIGLNGAVESCAWQTLGLTINASQLNKSFSQWLIRLARSPLPEDDNALNSAGRFYVGTTEVDGTSVSLGTLVIGYSFALFDPKIAPPPSGSTSGELAALNTDEEVDYANVTWSDAGMIYPLDGLLTIRGYRAANLTVAYNSNGGIVDVEIDGVVLPPVESLPALGVGDLRYTRRWILPAGRCRFVLVARTAMCADLRLVCYR